MLVSSCCLDNIAYRLASGSSTTARVMMWLSSSLGKPRRDALGGCATGLVAEGDAEFATACFDGSRSRSPRETISACDCDFVSMFGDWCLVFGR